MITYSVRQSPKWEEYLRFLGWKPVRTKEDIMIALQKSPLGTVTKIQRPKKFSKKELDEIIKICTKANALFIKIEPGYQQDTEIIEQAGFRKSLFPLSPPSTMFINLEKSEKDLWKNLSRSGKYCVRRAQREGAKMKYLQNPGDKDLERFFNIEKTTGKRGKFYVQPLKDLKAKRDIFKDESYLVEVYDKNNSLVSAKFYVGYKDLITYIHGGTSELGRKQKGGYELMWKSFLYFKEKGYKSMDLEGVDDERFPMFTKDWGGFSYFKEKFGGEIVRFPSPYVRYESKFLKFTDKFLPVPI